jgi:hypothetical protein
MIADQCLTLSSASQIIWQEYVVKMGSSSHVVFAKLRIDFQTISESGYDQTSI